MITLLEFREWHDDRSVLVNSEEISSLEEADGNTTVVTLKSGKAWRVLEPLSEIKAAMVKLAGGDD